MFLRKKSAAKDTDKSSDRMNSSVKHASVSAPPRQVRSTDQRPGAQQAKKILDEFQYPTAPKEGSMDRKKYEEQVKEMRCIMEAQKQRALFHVTPPNKHLDLGKDKNELEMLLEKFQPEFEQMVPAMCDALECVITEHSLRMRRKSVMQGEAAERFKQFDTSATPEISLRDYLWRIVDYTYISPTSLVLACILIDKLINSGLLLSYLNVYKLFFTSVRVASKVHELRSLSNKNFAVVGGVTTEQMNTLESAFVGYFGWDLWVEHEVFSGYCERLMPAGRQRPIGMIPM